MYTLKIRWNRFERKTISVGRKPDEAQRVDSLEDETTLFIPAEEVRVHGAIDAGTREDVMKSWDENGSGYYNYLSVTVDATEDTCTTREDGGRLIQVIRPSGEEQWYLATLAWLLGPNGDTIERVAP